MADKLTVPPPTPKSKSGKSAKSTPKTVTPGPSKTEMPTVSVPEKPVCTCGPAEPPPVEKPKPKNLPTSPVCDKVKEAEEKLALERKERERVCKEMGARYSLPTRMGFWFDSQASAELQAEAYRAKFMECKTLKQLVYQVQDYLFSTRKVAKFKPVVNYNTPMQIVSEVKRENSENLVLSTLITERQIVEDNLLTLREGCMVTTSYENRRLRRNCIILEPTSGSCEVSSVMYGDHFFIRLMDDPLYVMGDIPNLNNIGGFGNMIPVNLAGQTSRFCKFQVLHPISEKNMDVMGKEVPTFTSILINHVVSNQNLEVLLDKEMVSIFSRDYGVACHNSTASLLRTTGSNFWQFTTMTEEETTRELDEKSKEKEDEDDDD